MDFVRGIWGHYRQRPTTEDYEILPPGNRSSGEFYARSESPDSHPRRRKPPPRRAQRWLFLGGGLFLVFIGLVITVIAQGIPPSFEELYRYERGLPQHHKLLLGSKVNQTVAEGERFLRFPTAVWGRGLNNALQERILFSHLAELTNRAYVFEDYVWSKTPLRYTLYDFSLRPARMPFSAFVRGPITGGEGISTPAVSQEYYDRVCPPESRATLSTKDAPRFSAEEQERRRRRKVGGHPEDNHSTIEGDELVAWWVREINKSESPCLELGAAEGEEVFDQFLFGSSRILSLLPGLMASSTLKEFTWSPLVLSALMRNFDVLPVLSSEKILPGLVALHLRRGDYVRHCPRLAGWGMPYMGWNQLPTLPDRFNPEPYIRAGDEKARKQYYLDHCWPSNEQIVQRLRQIRMEHKGSRPLTRVYVLSNDWGFQLAKLQAELVEDGWEDAKSSADLVLDLEQTYVAAAVDMAIAQQSQVFVGNGFSSLTSNVNMLRLTKGLPPESMRFT